VNQAKSVCVVLGLVWALLIPSLAFADDDNGTARGCSNGTATYNPHCSAPEVPIAALYPTLGGLSFAAISVVRARRRRSDDE
jgi:hypothetical protein